MMEIWQRLVDGGDQADALLTGLSIAFDCSDQRQSLTHTVLIKISCTL